MADVSVEVNTAINKLMILEQLFSNDVNDISTVSDGILILIQETLELLIDVNMTLHPQSYVGLAEPE